MILLLALLAAQAVGGSAQPPRLEIEAPHELTDARARVASFDPQRLAGIVRLVGLADPGPEIRVVLADERSDWAGRVPPWTAGLAYGRAGVIVLFPERALHYPHDTLEDVLRHEVAHVLITRAAGGARVPRWFHEGLAMSAERDWRLEDRTRLIYELTLGHRVPLGELDWLFAGDRRDQIRAYALAGAFVRDLHARHGPAAARDILARLARGASFDAAFAEATRVALPEAEAAFWARQRLWTTWVPLLTSASVLWLAVTLLALFAMYRRRRRSAEIRRRWEAEEGEWPGPPPPTVH